jgi:hypothetical protein
MGTTMADYCYGCTLELTGEPEYARRNDMRQMGGAWALCEGCGAHRFTNEGMTLCGTRPRADDATMEPCERCLKVAP